MACKFDLVKILLPYGNMLYLRAMSDSPNISTNDNSIIVFILRLWISMSLLSVQVWNMSKNGAERMTSV